MADNKKPRMPEIEMENVRIVFKNFSGRGGPMNAAGDRNFCVILPHEVAEQMLKDGFNVKYLKPRDPDDEPTPFVKVKVNYDSRRPPRCVLISSRGKTTLEESDLSILDWAEIENVDMIISPYRYELATGSSGISIYLKSIYVTIHEDDLEKKYAEVPDSAASNVNWQPDTNENAPF